MLNSEPFSLYRRCDLCLQNTVHVMFRRAKRRVIMVRLRVLSSWLPKPKGFARRYAFSSETSEVTASILAKLSAKAICQLKRPRTSQNSVQLFWLASLKKSWQTGDMMCYMLPCSNHRASKLYDVTVTYFQVTPFLHIVAPPPH